MGNISDVYRYMQLKMAEDANLLMRKRTTVTQESGEKTNGIEMILYGIDFVQYLVESFSHEW